MMLLLIYLHSIIKKGNYAKYTDNDRGVREKK